jgi:hypothetical protein
MFSQNGIFLSEVYKLLSKVVFDGIFVMLHMVDGKIYHFSEGEFAK